MHINCSAVPWVFILHWVLMGAWFVGLEIMAVARHWYLVHIKAKTGTFGLKSTCFRCEHSVLLCANKSKIVRTVDHPICLCFCLDFPLLVARNDERRSLSSFCQAWKNGIFYIDPISSPFNIETN